MSASSYRTILRSSSIIGGAKVINIAVSLVKMKVVAVLLGPAGVGLVGLYINLMQAAAAIAAVGIGTTGTRQIAPARAEGRNEAVDRTRRTLFWGTLGLALIGALLFWLSSGWIARVILADPALSTDVAWLSLGVALSETLGIGVFVLGIFVGPPLIGVNATGVAFLALYVAYLPIVWYFGGRRIGFRWSRAVKAQALAVIAAAVAVDTAARWSDIAGALLGTTLAAGLGVWALRRLSSQAGGRPGRVGAMGEKMKIWTIQRF